MKNYFIIFLASIILTGCGSFGLNGLGVFEIEKTGDNGIIVFNDEDVKLLPDGSIDSDITSIFIIEVQAEEETATIFSEAFKMLSDFFSKHAEVYKSIGE